VKDWRYRSNGQYNIGAAHYGACVNIEGMALKLIVPAFADGGLIPKLHTCDGANISPSVEWSGEPAETRSFTLIVDDPDAPGGSWNHWLLYDLPPSVRSLAQGYKPGKLGLSGTNDFDHIGYGGPCPPKGHGPHRYFFRLYALDVASLGLPAGARRAQIDKAIQGHTLAEAQHVGRYERH
jgi:Raf kinase inhibitor-like YbhB/YbcL family protein